MNDSIELARLVGKLEATCEMKILARDKRIEELKAEKKAYEQRENAYIAQIKYSTDELQALRDEAVKALNRSGLGHMCELQDLWDILEPPEEGNSDD